MSCPPHRSRQKNRLERVALGPVESRFMADERAYSEGAGNDIYCIRVDPMLDELRKDPRFEALAEKIVPVREFRGSSK